MLSLTINVILFLKSPISLLCHGLSTLLVHFSKLLVVLRFIFYSPPTSHPLFQPGLERISFGDALQVSFSQIPFSPSSLLHQCSKLTLKLPGQLLAKPSKGPLFVFLSPCMVHPPDNCHRSPSTVYSTYQVVVQPQAFQGFRKPCANRKEKARCSYQGLQGLPCCP